MWEPTPVPERDPDHFGIGDKGSRIALWSRRRFIAMATERPLPQARRRREAVADPR